jgi:hypothetical protein
MCFLPQASEEDSYSVQGLRLAPPDGRDGSVGAGTCYQIYPTQSISRAISAGKAAGE